GNRIGEGVAILSALPFGRGTVKAGTYLVDEAALRAAAAGADGAVDARRADALLRGLADGALANRGRVILHGEDGPRRIVGRGLVDEQGRSWDSSRLLEGKAHIEIELPGDVE